MAGLGLSFTIKPRVCFEAEDAVWKGDKRQACHMGRQKGSVSGPESSDTQ